MDRFRGGSASLAPAWGPLYRAGGVSGGLFVACLVTAILLAILTPSPPTAGGAATLEFIATHRTLYLLSQQLWLVPGVFAAVVYLALFPALRPLHPSVAALGCAVGGIAWALTLAMPTTSTGAPALVYLSDQYTVAGDPTQRAAFVAAAEGLIALNRTPTAVGVLTTIGMLIVSQVMLQGAFPRWVAYLGIATGVLGIASEALRPVIEGGYAVYGLLLLVWMGAVAWRLFRLGKDTALAPPASDIRTVVSDRVMDTGSNCLGCQGGIGHKIAAVAATGACGAHRVRCLRSALRMVSSLRMQAVRATFLVLPAARRRVYRACRTGLRRLPTRAAIYKAARTVARPPQIVRLPRSVPLSRLIGARPGLGSNGPWSTSSFAGNWP